MKQRINGLQFVKWLFALVIGVLSAVFLFVFLVTATKQRMEVASSRSELLGPISANGWRQESLQISPSGRFVFLRLHDAIGLSEWVRLTRRKSSWEGCPRVVDVRVPLTTEQLTLILSLNDTFYFNLRNQDLRGLSKDDLGNLAEGARVVDVSGCKLSRVFLEQMSQASNLLVLNISDCEFQDDWFRSCAHFGPSFKAMIALRSSFSQQGIRLFGRSRGEYLEISGVRLTEDAFHDLSHSNWLRVFISMEELNEREYNMLSEIPSVETLVVRALPAGAKISDQLSVLTPAARAAAWLEIGEDGTVKLW